MDDEECCPGNGNKSDCHHRHPPPSAIDDRGRLDVLAEALSFLGIGPGRTRDAVHGRHGEEMPVAIYALQFVDIAVNQREAGMRGQTSSIMLETSTSLGAGCHTTSPVHRRGR